ncbi:hypothetical protein CRENBAI_003871 [Crenichthys baileyi]|uniref:Uncharacterized protein n=1 Tax=Crenichthys baileyi TaxID=28760 RepID=A0AAV9SR48_9TELE
MFYTPTVRLSARRHQPVKNGNCTTGLRFCRLAGTPGGMRPAEFGSVGRGVPELGRVEIPGGGGKWGHEAHERDTANASGWGVAREKSGSAFTPPPFGGPRSHGIQGRNGGAVLLGARPRTTYPSLSLLEGVLRTTSS